ncbi:MAG: hypothetical protein JXA57_10560 [Armatimonadetes bacterium]|nr:hypothetical protein [Armatimonadota bacterium]
MLRRLAVVLTLIALAALAVKAFAAPTSEQPDPSDAGSDARMLVPADPAWNLWPTNERGQTYGTPQETAVGYHEPDLMRVLATNGKTGYALSADLAGPEPSSPEEALEWQAEHGSEPRTIPVYESDGVTQIGVFDIGGR